MFINKKNVNFIKSCVYIDYNSIQIMNFNKIYENTFFSNVDIYTACKIHEHCDPIPTL